MKADAYKVSSLDHQWETCIDNELTFFPVVNKESFTLQQKHSEKVVQAESWCCK